MEVVKKPTLKSLTIDMVKARIRIDQETGRGSVSDVITLVTGTVLFHSPFSRPSVRYAKVCVRMLYRYISLL